MKIDIANQAGFDKQQFEDRIAWVDANESKLESFIEAEETDDKYRYVAAVMAYREIQAGKPTGHLVGLDACAQGPQIMSCIMRDMVGATNTSLVGGIRNDLYQKTTDTMNTLLPTTVTYKRKQVKKALMPRYYGSQAKPKELFGEDTPEYEAFMEAQAQVCPGAAYLMPILKNSWNAYTEEHSWVLSDGFRIRAKVLETVEKNIEVDELDHLRFNYRYKTIAGKETGVANIAK